MMDTLGILAHEINQAIYEASGGSRLAPHLFSAASTSPSAFSPTSTPAASPPSFATATAPASSDTSPCPLGLFTHLIFEPAIQAFEPGARMLLVTKGILEAPRGRQQFGIERATAVLQNIPSTSAFRPLRRHSGRRTRIQKTTLVQPRKTTLRQIRTRRRPDSSSPSFAYAKTPRCKEIPRC